MLRFSRTLLVAFALLSAAALGVGTASVGTVALLPNVLPAFSHAAENSPAAAPSPEAHHAAALSEAFRAVAKDLRPSVVSIDSLTVVKASGRRSMRPEMRLPPEFERFFGDDFFDRFEDGQLPDQDPDSGFEQRGLGTGVIVSADGYIVTNNHVVRGADELTVNLSDGRQLQGEVVGADAQTDLAVIKVEAAGLSAAKLGDSKAMAVGDWVVAIGTPFGLDQTVTAGIISATGRSAVGITDYEDFLQTDAAINPGNSGGPLVNMAGQVVGINTAIASRTGAYNGIGFAIPSNMVRHVMQSIIKTGHVDRGWLGAAIQDLNEDLAQSFGFESNEGVLIGDVVKGGPAEQAGLKAGDIVVEFNGNPMRDSNELRHNTAPHTRVELAVFRDGQRRTISVTLGLLKDDERVETDASPSGDKSESVSKLGLSVGTLDAETAERLGFDATETGALVTGVESGSLAARGGIREGDLIVGVNGRAIKSAADFRDTLKGVDTAKGVRLSVRRDGVQHFVFLRDSR
jgi:serine protease Do